MGRNSANSRSLKLFGGYPKQITQIQLEKGENERCRGTEAETKVLIIDVWM
jgi:hypothetical protein